MGPLFIFSLPKSWKLFVRYIEFFPTTLLSGGSSTRVMWIFRRIFVWRVLHDSNIDRRVINKKIVIFTDRRVECRLNKPIVAVKNAVQSPGRSLWARTLDTSSSSPSVDIPEFNRNSEVRKSVPTNDSTKYTRDHLWVYLPAPYPRSTPGVCSSYKHTHTHTSVLAHAYRQMN